MHCRKLHTKQSDRKKLYEALKALYREGVRIPVGKPYEQRRKTSPTIEEQSPASDEKTCGLELVRDEGPYPDADGDPYRRI